VPGASSGEAALCLEARPYVDQTQGSQTEASDSRVNPGDADPIPEKSTLELLGTHPLGTAAGVIGGAITGAVIGIAAGPVGSLAGAIGGAIAGGVLGSGSVGQAPVTGPVNEVKEHAVSDQSRENPRTGSANSTELAQGGSGDSGTPRCF
jgi:hypothetical protein